MRLPRWTVWPALAVLAAFLLPAIPWGGEEKSANADAPVAPSKHPRVVVLGIDGMDPELLQETIQRFPERTKNFQALIAKGGLHSLGTSIPPQSPVAWSNFITGMDPGGHGIFDFIHRSTVTRGPEPSTTKESHASSVSLGETWVFPIGGDSESNRTGKAFWTILAEHGVPADIWRMPANFPVEPAEGWSFSGMMTPAIDSAYGQYKLYTNAPELLARLPADKVQAVSAYDGVIDTELSGPANPFRKDQAHATVPMRIYLDPDARLGGEKAPAAVVELGEEHVLLRVGEWSPFLRVSFELVPHAVHVGGEARFYLKTLESAPDLVALYCSPVNIDPMDPIAPVSEPKKASQIVAEKIGLYYTQGMPEDVNALKDRALTDAEFMAQSELVHDEGVRMLDFALDRWRAKPDGGFLFFYFSGVDLCSHMMWRHADAKHPHHDAEFAEQDSSRWSKRAGSTWKDVLDDLYLQMDPILGRVMERMPADTLLLVMSDHGFAPYYRKFSLNTWLWENGYLVLKDGLTKEKPRNDPEFRTVDLGDVDWSKTRAYGMGFNGLYLNLAGREGLDASGALVGAPGIVSSKDADALLRELKQKLELVVDPKNGERVVVRCDLARDVYHGARTGEAPDLIVGYASGYDNSDQASLGRVTNQVLEDNLGGTFNGSHLMAPEVVPGCLMTNGVVEGEGHRLEDLTVEILRRYGVARPAQMAGKPVLK